MLRKYATATVISAEIARPNTGLIKDAHRAVFNYKPRPGFLYARSRMISSRCNDNHDEFPAEEIRKAWKTAIGKPVFVNHHNEDHRRMRGVIIDAVLHEDVLPDGKPDVWIEALHEIDARRFPKLAKAILEGRVNRTSMGTDVGYSICSACGNKASTPAEYCQHIPQMKGKILYRHTASGQREGHLIREICYKLGFFENSFLVEDPADPTAVVTGVDDRGLKATASSTQTIERGQELSHGDGPPPPAEMDDWGGGGGGKNEFLIIRHRPNYFSLTNNVDDNQNDRHVSYHHALGDAVHELAHLKARREFDPRELHYAGKPDFKRTKDMTPEFQVHYSQWFDKNAPNHNPHPVVAQHSQDMSDQELAEHWKTFHNSKQPLKGTPEKQRQMHEAWHGQMDWPQGGHRSPEIHLCQSTRRGESCNYKSPGGHTHAPSMGDLFGDSDALNSLFEDGQGPTKLSALASSLPKVADYHVTCDRPGCGMHWGPHGAAGLLIRHHDPEDGQTRYLLQKRAPWVDHGDTWGIPGGALHEGESPEEGAEREAGEEMGELPSDLRHHKTHTDDHGGWAYHTVVLDSPERFHPGGGGDHSYGDSDDDYYDEDDWGYGDGEASGHGWFTKQEMKNMDLHPGFAQSLSTVTGDHHHVHSSLPSTEAIVYKNPTDHPFFQDVPLHPKHIISTYDEADAPTRAQGMRWYSDGHQVAKALDPDGDAHRGAGVLAAYSPRSNWPINLFNASRSLQQRRAVRIGEGMNVMGNHAKSAAKILEDGKHYLEAFTTPKITDFAHLLAHGGDDDECPTCEPHKKPDHPEQRVVVDRHALSAAAGRRMNDNDLGRAPLGTRKFYEHVADQYREAAAHISERDGVTVHPHQLQAVTWLQQQKRNAAQETEEAASDPKAKGRLTREKNAWTAWEEHSRQHHPEFHTGDEEVNMHLRNPHAGMRSSLPMLAFRKGAPFAGYEDFEDCEEKNADKDSPDEYCGEISKRTEGSRSSLPRVTADTHPETGCPSCGNTEDFNQVGAVGACNNCGDTFDARKSLQQNMVNRQFQQNLADEREAKEESDRKAFEHITPNRTIPHPGSPPVLPEMAHEILWPERVRKAGPIPGVPKGDELKARQELMLSRSKPHRLQEGPAPLHSLNSLGSLLTLAYGEVKAPQDVDTLRTESCPVCGETDAFDGDRCQVCNFLQPPSMFTDPDTGVARQMDLRKDEMGQQTQVGPDGQPLPGQDPGMVDPNDPNGQDPAMEGLPGQAGDQIADLFCPACGFSADTQEPMTNNDPSMPSEQQGLMEGDVCPNCGQATMLSPNDVGAMGGEVPQEIADDADADGMPDDQEPDVDEDGIPDDAEPDEDQDGRPDDAEDDDDQDEIPDDADPDDDGDGEADAVEDQDEAPKGRKDNARRV